MNRTKDKTRRSTVKASSPQAGTNAAGTASGPSSTGVSNAVQNNSLTNRSGAPPLNRSTSTKLRPSNSAVNRSVASQPTVYHFQPVVITASAPGTNKASGGPPATATGDVIELDPVVITADGSDDQQQPDGKKPKGGAAGASPATGQQQPGGAKRPGAKDGGAASEAAPGSGASPTARRTTMRYAGELAEPPTAESPPSLSAMSVFQPLSLMWQMLTGDFPAPPALQLEGSKPLQGDQAKASFSEAKRLATDSYQSTAAVAKTEHDQVLREANSAIQAVYIDYFGISNQLLFDFQQSDAQIESSYQWAVSQVCSGAAAADDLIVTNYALARGLLSGAVSSSKAAILKNSNTAKTQITIILSGLVQDFVEPIDEASGDCQTASDNAKKKLADWKANIPSKYADVGSPTLRVEKEAVRLTAPKLADETLKSLAAATTDILAQFDSNKKLVQADIHAKVAPSLTKHAGEIVTKGNASVDEAFSRAYGALKQQADSARQANTESRDAAVEQLYSLRKAERERLESEMELALTALHQEAAAATDSLFSSNARALPNYGNTVGQLHGSLSKASAMGPATLKNIANEGAKGVTANLIQARDLQLQQVATISSGTQNGLAGREAGAREQLSAAFNMAQQYLNESSTASSDGMMVTSQAMTEGFSSMADGVTAAAQSWIMPLDKAFSEFLGTVEDELDDGKDAFDTRLKTAKEEFESSAQRQANAEQAFAGPLQAAQTAAVTKVTTATLALSNALDAGIFNRIDEEGVGNALRGLTRIQGLAVRDLWGGEWRKPFNDPMMRSAYISATGSEVYTLDGHLLTDLGEGSNDYNAAINYLNGNTAEGARYELEASMHWYNDEESRMENIMRSLTPEQLEALHGLKEWEGTSKSVHSALDGTDLDVHKALEAGNHFAADAYRQRDELNAARRQNDDDATNAVLAKYSTGAVYGGVEVSGAERREGVQRELAKIQGIDLQARGAEIRQAQEAAEAQRAAEAERAAQSGQTPVPEPERIPLVPLNSTAAGQGVALARRGEGTPPAPGRGPPASATDAPATTESSRTAPTAEGESKKSSIADRWLHRIPTPPSDAEKQKLAEAQAASQSLYDYAVRPIEELRSSGEHTYTVTLTMNERQKDLAHAYIFYGEGSPQARAAILGVEAGREGKPNIVNLDKALVDPRLSPDLQVADPALKKQIQDRALEERRQMMEIFAAKYGGWTEGSKADPAEVVAGQLQTAFGDDTAGGELAALLARHEHPSPETAAKAMEYAIEGAGTNNELIDRTVGRMNRDDIARMRRAYQRNTGDDLYADLGVFGHGILGDLSGDDRLRVERLLLGQPRNDRERYEVAQFTIQQQRDEAGLLGGWLAGGSLQELMLDKQEARLNELGGKVKFGPDGLPQWSDGSAFNANNDFMGDAAEFHATTEGAQLAAQNYSSKIDQYANAAAMGIAILGAIAATVATVLTGGAASPLLLAAIAGITGLTAMGAQRLIKGGRYGWEAAAQDLGMTAVQMLTAGVGQSLALASRGGMAGVRAGMGAGWRSLSGARQVANSGVLGNMGKLTGNAFADKVLIGMGTGGLGAMGSAAVSPDTWAKGTGKGLDNLLAAGFRGILTGGVTAGVTNAIEDLPLNKLPLGGRLSGVLGKGTIGEAIGGSTSVVGRGLGKSLTSSVGAFAGRSAELGYESARGTYKGDAGDIFLASAEAAGMSAFQSFAEGGAEARAQAIYNTRYGGQPGIDGLPAGLRPPGAPERLPTIDGMPELPAGTRPLAPTPEGPIAEPTPVVRPRGADTPLPEGPLPGARRPAGEAEAAPTPRRPELEPTRPAPLPGEPGVEGSTGIPPRPIAAEPSLADADLGGVPRRAPTAEEAAAVPVKEGAAAAIPGSGMRLLSDIPLATATPKQLRQAALEAIRRVPALAGGKVKWVKGGGALFVTITRANGKTARVRVEFGDTTGGDVASFRRPNERSNDFIVTLSNKAPPEAYARGIAHELGEIRVHGLKQHAGEADVLTARTAPTGEVQLSAHDRGRLAELEVLAGQLSDAKALTANMRTMKALKANNADIDRLKTEIDALSAHLGLLHSKPSDPRLTLAERAIGEESAARQELTNARQRAAKERPRDALRPARAIDDETRLTAADRSKLAAVEELAARMERAQEIDAPTRAKEIEQEAVQQLKRMGLLDSDEATDFRVRLASSAFEADSPGLRLLTKTRTERRAEFAGSNDVLRPGFRPDSRSVLSANDRVQLGIVSGKKSRPIVRILQELMHAERRNASDIEAIRQAAEDEMRGLGLGSRDKAAEKQANLVIMALGGPNSRFGGRFAEIRQSALENMPPTRVRPATAEAQPSVDIAGAQARAELVKGRPALQQMFEDEPELRLRFDDAVDHLHHAVGGLSKGDQDALAQLFRTTLREPGGGIGRNRLRANIQTLERLAEIASLRPHDFQESGQNHRRRTLQTVGKDVVEAFNKGRTADGEQRPIQSTPKLRAQIDDLKKALAEFTLTNNRLADAIALDRLQRQIALAGEGLSARSRRFVGETTVEQYLREKVRTSIEILSDEKLLTLLTVKVTAEGIPGESLSRGLPGMSKEKHLKTPKELGKLKRIDPDLAERLEFLLAGYHRAHLVGPGFGGELRAGIMLAPSDFNLKTQNDGIERVIRALPGGGRSATVRLQATGTRIVVPQTDGTFRYIDVLRSVTYEIHLAGKKSPLTVEFLIGPPPGGKCTLGRNDIPVLTEYGIDPEWLRRVLNLRVSRR